MQHSSLCIFIYLSERPTTSVNVYIPSIFQERKTTFAGKELFLFFIFCLIISEVGFQKVSGCLSGFDVTLYNKSSLLRAPKKTKSLRLGTYFQCAYFGISAEGSGSKLLITKVPHEESKSHNFIFKQSPLLTVERSHSGLAAHPRSGLYDTEW